MSVQGPVILAQPQRIEAKLGETAAFSVRASGKGALRYQWRFNGARIIGSTSANLALSNITASDEGEYTVEITDDAGTVLSNSARLLLFRDSDGDGLGDGFERGVGRYELVSGSFTWGEAKADAEKRGGHLATIVSQTEWDSIVAVMGDFYARLSIWLGGTDAVTEGSWKWITGEPWGYTRWPSGEPDNLGDQDYVLAIGNGLWNDYAPSLRAHYLLELGFYTDPNKPDTDGDGFNDGIEYEAGSIPTDSSSRPLPKIIAQPQSVNVIAGSAFTLAVSANGYGSLTYQWRRNGVAITGATAATFSLSNAQHANAGVYDVVLRNASGTRTSAPALIRITPVLEVERLNNGFVAIQLLDSWALGWVVETSADLKTWQRLGAMTYADGLGVFLDAAAVGKPQRFYRVVSP